MKIRCLCGATAGMPFFLENEEAWGPEKTRGTSVQHHLEEWGQQTGKRIQGGEAGEAKGEVSDHKFAHQRLLRGRECVHLWEGGGGGGGTAHTFST